MQVSKISTAFVIVAIVISPSILKAAEPNSFAICDWSAEQSYPAVSGNYVVWQDKRSGMYDIYRNKGTDMNDANGFLVCGANRNQQYPAISGNIIVWQDYRSTTNYDIYRWLLPTGPENSVCTLTSKQENPAVSGSVIVWQDNRNSSDDIYGYNLATGEFPICVLDGTQSNPAISGNIVVWQDTRNGGMDIYSKNLNTMIESVVCISSYFKEKPAICGNIVVWQDKRNGDSDIYGKNISTGEELEICKFSGEQTNPAVSGDIVVWEDYRSGTADIYGYRISTQTVFPICTSVGSQKNPAVDGSLVVWTDCRIDASGDIYGAYILAPIVPSFITVLDPNGGEMLLEDSEYTIRWQTTGTPIVNVKLEYSTNGGTSYSIIDSNAANTGTYLWQIPSDIDSNQCVIRITDSAVPPAASDTSNYVFTIFTCDQSLTADLDGDCKVDFADFAFFSGQWLTCGNPHDPNWRP